MTATRHIERIIVKWKIHVVFRIFAWIALYIVRNKYDCQEKKKKKKNSRQKRVANKK